VLDTDGNPVPGVKVRAMPQDSIRDLGLEGWEAVPNDVAKERTDKQGRFVISQLPDIPLCLTSDGVHADTFFELDPSQGTELIYRGRVADRFQERMDAQQ